MRPLESDDQKQFREDYRQTETEIQKNIAVYLSALVIATGWIFGPQSKPIVQLFLGNEGLNLFGFIVLIAINVVFTCFLTYKSVQVHEIMQFATYLAPQDSPLLKWEGWRRSPQSLSKRWFVRPLYFLSISLVPLWASILLMWSVGHYIWKPASTLAQQIQEVESHTLPLVSSEPKLQTPPNASTETKPESQNVTANSKAQELFQALDGRVQHELRWARTWWIIIGLFHFIPIWFFLVTWLKANAKWDEIKKLKNMPDFKTLLPLDDATDAPLE